MASNINFVNILKRRFSLKTLSVLLATAWIISYLDLEAKISSQFPTINPDGVFLQVMIIGTIFQLLKSVVELIFDNGFG